MPLTLTTARQAIAQVARGSLKELGDVLSAIVTGDFLPQAITASAAEINQAADYTMQAVTTTADGLTTGTILPASNYVLITSASATNFATLPGIAANALAIGHTIKGRVTANGCELVTLATSGETINGVDGDGTNQLDVPAQGAFIAWVESATGWALVLTATATPDND